MNIREQINQNDMSPFQVTAVVVCILAGIIVGFGILILPFTAPAIADSWSLPYDRLGALLSASLAGMMIGAIVIAPFADNIGRRKTILFSMTLITVGLLYSGYAGDAKALMIARLVTGLGIGGSAASINTLIAEYCSNKWRDLAIGIYISGGALSGILGGALTAYFVANYDWSAAFVFGAVVSALMTISLVIWLPESVDFLLTRQPENALQRINKLLGRMRMATIDALPEVSTESVRKGSIWVIVSKPYLLKSVLMWISIFAVFTGFYFITSWTPKLLVDAGWTLQQAIFVTVMIKAGGVFAGFGFGYLSQQIGYRWTIRGVLILTGVFFVLFGLAGDDFSLRFVLPLFLGFFLFGTLITQYALLPRVYETKIRNTGTGWATGIGRFGAMAAPYIAGQMLAAGWDGMNLYFIYSITYLVAIVAVSLIWSTTQE